MDFELFTIVTDGRKTVIADLIELFNDKLNENDFECLSNTFITYLNGDIQQNTTEQFWDEIEKSIPSNFSNENLRSFMDVCLKTKFMTDSMKIVNVLEKLLSTISNKNNNNNNNNKYIKTNFIWSFETFRNCICLIKTQNILDISISYGLFCPFFPNSKKTNDTNKIIESLEPLLNDKKIHNSILNYIGSQMSANCFSKSYVQNYDHDYDYGYDYYEFVSRLIINIYNQYTKEEIDHDIMKNMDKGNETIIFKTILLIKIFMDLCCSISNKKKLETIAKFVFSQFVKKIFSKFTKILKNNDFKISCMYKQCTNTYCFENVFTKLIVGYIFSIENNKKNHVGQMTYVKNIYNYLVYVIGNKYDKFNIHTRYDTFTFLSKLIPLEGFEIFEDHLTNDLLKYINDLDPNTLGLQYLEIIDHQEAVTRLLSQLMDTRNYINESTKYIFPESLYKLISRNSTLIEYFTNPNLNSYSPIIKEFPLVQEILLCTMAIFNTAKITNSFQYPEIDDKIMRVIEKIFKLIPHSSTKTIVNINQNDILGKCLIDVSIDIILSNTCDINDIKETIENLIQYVQLNDTQKILIQQKLKLCSEQNVDDIPDEFTDPLTYKQIKTPIMIQESNAIYERMSIITQIYENGVNPITRKKLTLEMIEKYNKEQHVIDKISEFTNKLNEWISQNKSS